jgi:transcriptional regulator with XRE-family HTH domain
MDYRDIKLARQALGLSLSEFAEMLDTDPTTTRRLEMAPHNSTARQPAPRMVRLIQAYLDGYRPTDWPIEIEEDGFVTVYPEVR